MASGKENDNTAITATMDRAIELTEEALAQVARIAVQEIHVGLEANDHVEAAERDMRNALRQLVLAERELLARPLVPSRMGVAREPIIEVVPDPDADGARRGG